MPTPPVTTRVVRERDIPTDLRFELARLSERWLDGARERGFSMILDGMLTGAHPDCLLVIAYVDSRVVAFQRYAPVGTALSLDTMRRDREGPNGLNERMIVDLVEYASDHGVDLISLNFAAFRSLMDAGSSRGVVQQAAYRALHVLDPLIQLESLYLFNAKFRPTYQPRAVAFGSWLGLPTVIMAMVGMEFGLGYDRHRPLEPSLLPDRRQRAVVHPIR
ncbi:phosphatidylglycerol lysyltransferase domain-containing protein [Kibdelosporangium lantanae]|uniref:Phosphatidylglycerol lysyltransferase domain-containing protein n=1 Tax=Kibdelosporangium lantanae TaxID=1497396 RepID=A0ABW3M1V0_9PSEU